MTATAPNLPDWPWPVVAMELSSLVRNAEATLVELRHPEATLPMIIPDLNPQLDPSERSWVSCMESGLYGYLIDEWRRKSTPTLIQEAFIRGYLATGGWGPWRRAVQVGHYPYSTTLRTEITNRVLWEILPALRESMPDRPFAVRNVYPDRQALKLPEDAYLIPTRPIYRFDYANGKTPNVKNFRRDLKLLSQDGLVRIFDDQFDERRIHESLELYQQLYRDKHSLRNPDYTPEMIHVGRTRGWLGMRGLVDPETDRLVAFAGVHEIGRELSAPMIGYDFSVPQKKGLYRQLLASLAQEAMDRGMIDDSSSGAGEFKRNRGLIPEMEQLVILPPLTGARRVLDRAMIRLRSSWSRGITLESMIANGG
jgi:hypothetical protein